MRAYKYQVVGATVPLKARGLPRFDYRDVRQAACKVTGGRAHG